MSTPISQILKDLNNIGHQISLGLDKFKDTSVKAIEIAKIQAEILQFASVPSNFDNVETINEMKEKALKLQRLREEMDQALASIF